LWETLTWPSCAPCCTMSSRTRRWAMSKSLSPDAVGPGEALDADSIPNLPADFLLEYCWREGTVPPPYHYEYRVRLDASGDGEVLFYPDYPSEQPPEWRESFPVPPLELRRLYQQIVEGKVLSQTWELIPDMEAPIGGELESLEIVVNAQRYTVPSAIVDASRVEAIYRLIRSLVPETTWRTLMERREAYIREQLGE